MYLNEVITTYWNQVTKAKPKFQNKFGINATI